MTEAEQKMCLRPIRSKKGITCWDYVPIDSLKPVYGDLYASMDTGKLWIFNGTRWVTYN